MTEGAPLRSLLAQFHVEVDRAGALVRGNAQVEALKNKLVKVDAVAKATTASVQRMAAAIGAAAKASVGGGMLGGSSPKMLGAGGPGGALATVASGGGLARIGGVDALAGWRQAAEAAVPAANRWRSAVDGIRESLNQPRLGAIAGVFNMTNAIRGFVAVSAIGAVKGLVDQIGGIGEEASKLGVTNAEFQRMTVLAAQNATSVGALGTAFRTLATSAVNPTQESTEALRQLGVETKASDGTFKSRQDLFFETAGALADIEDGTKRAALAQKLYGRSALELAPLLAGGRAGLEAQRAELEKLPVLSDATIAAADRFSDRWEYVKVQLLALAGPVLEKVVIPVFQFLLDTVSTAADVIAKLTKNLNPMAIGFAAAVVAVTPYVGQLRALIALGGGWGKVMKSLGGGAKALARSYAPLIAAFLVLEDLFVFFTGGKSLTGRGLEKVFGKGFTQTVNDLRDAFKDLWKWVLGDGAGEKAKALYSEVEEGVGLIAHDALVGLGVREGETGLEGMRDFQSGKTGLSKGARLLGGVDANDPFMAKLREIGDRRNGNMPLPGGPAGAYGPPAPPGTMVQANGDRVVQVTVANTSDARAVAGAVRVELERDRNAILSGHP